MARTLTLDLLCSNARADDGDKKGAAYLGFLPFIWRDTQFLLEGFLQRTQTAASVHYSHTSASFHGYRRSSRGLLGREFFPRDYWWREIGSCNTLVTRSANDYSLYLPLETLQRESASSTARRRWLGLLLELA